MKAGKKYGQGVYGITYDFACQNNDNDTLCNMLKEKRIKTIQLHSFDNYIELDDKLIKRFIKYMHKLNCCVAKVFKSYMIGIDKKGFKEELAGMKIIHKIFGNQTEKLTTLTSLKLFDFNFVAAYIIFEDNSHIYVTFTKKCDMDLEHYKLIKLNQIIDNILETFTYMQKKNFVHCDFKPDNMIYCSEYKRFKVIDWGLSKFAKEKVRMYGTLTFSSPIALYVSGVPKSVVLSLNHLSCWKDKINWFNSKIYNELYDIIKSDYNSVINQTRSELFKRYYKKFDIYNFGMSLAYLIHKNKLNWNKHKTFIIKLISLNGFQNAEEALNSHRSANSGMI
jgi:serine/threonine protein kinase